LVFLTIFKRWSGEGSWARKIGIRKKMPDPRGNKNNRED